MKITSMYHYMPGMSEQAKSTVHATVAYAEQNKHTRVHSMSLAEFCDLANLPRETTRTQVVSILSETRRATMAVRIIDKSAAGQKELLNGSWPIFLSILVTGSHVSFEVCPYTWKDFD